ncbi:hypothetical protein RhiJN_02992 [Ceratobasidium sp. AG-Ba]|nr:hypothetical protein RhiJN_02992 [Ceratobasidium sp. AG-Ba]QRW03880.1 hypothetical protein RhiLY_02879 [Ceratobasidium sp. AG-Ba]
MIQGMISAWITTEYGAALPEFDVKHAEGRVDCWIPSIQGANFCINWHSLNPSTFGLRGDIWLDGVPVGGGLLMPNETRGIKMTGHSAGNVLERPYHFGKQQLTDDESVSDPADPRLLELNTIRLVLDWVYVTEERQYTQPTAPPKLGPVHERAAKKAHGDSAGLGNARPVPPRQWYNTQSIGMKKTVLVFHYAPQDWLLAKKIISAPLKIKSEPRTITGLQPKREADKPQRPGGPNIIDWFGPASSPSTAGPSRATASSSTQRPQAGPSQPNTSPSRKRARDQTPILHIYDSDDDVEQILSGSPQGSKRAKTGTKLEPLETPVGTFTNGEVIDLTGDDSD